MLLNIFQEEVFVVFSQLDEVLYEFFFTFSCFPWFSPQSFINCPGHCFFMYFFHSTFTTRTCWVLSFNSSWWGFNRRNRVRAYRTHATAEFEVSCGLRLAKINHTYHNFHKYNLLLIFLFFVLLLMHSKEFCSTTYG